MSSYFTYDWIMSCITPESVEQYNSAQPGEILGLYVDSTIRIGSDVGTEEDLEERPIAILRPLPIPVDRDQLALMLYLEFTREPMRIFSVAGHEAIEKTVASGNRSSARINVPPSWQGKKVLVITLEK